MKSSSSRNSRFRSPFSWKVLGMLSTKTPEMPLGGSNSIAGSDADSSLKASTVDESQGATAN